MLGRNRGEAAFLPQHIEGNETHMTSLAKLTFTTRRRCCPPGFSPTKRSNSSCSKQITNPPTVKSRGARLHLLEGAG